MFAPGRARATTLPPIAMGSHLDTQPTGGKFDGVLGVLGALEAMRTWTSGLRDQRAVEIVNWTNEEGSRFAPAMLASGVYAGVFTPDMPMRARTARARHSATSLSGIGYRGAEKAGRGSSARCSSCTSSRDRSSRTRSRMIGIVTGVQGMRWYEVTVHRPGGAYRRDADASAQERAARRGAHDRARSTRSRWSMRRGGRHRRPDREPAEQPQRRAGRGLLHRRFPPSRRADARRDGERVPRRAARDPAAARSSSSRRSGSGSRRR